MIIPCQKGFFTSHKILDVAISTHEIIQSMDMSDNVGMVFKLDISNPMISCHGSFS